MIKTSQQIDSLDPGGVWANLGPHSDVTHMAQELSTDEVVGVVLFVKPDCLSFHL